MHSHGEGEREKERQFDAHFEQFLFDHNALSHHTDTHTGEPQAKSRRLAERRARERDKNTPPSLLLPQSLAHTESERLRPPSPPIFEGDYFFLEFVRLHRLALQRQLYPGGSPSLMNGKSHHNSLSLLQKITLSAKRARSLLQSLLSRSQSSPFRRPVDPVALGLPHYLQVVKHPMDLSTVRRKLKESQYETVKHFAQVRIWKFVRSCLCVERMFSTMP